MTWKYIVWRHIIPWVHNLISFGSKQSMQDLTNCWWYNLLGLSIVFVHQGMRSQVSNHIHLIQTSDWIKPDPKLEIIVCHCIMYYIIIKNMSSSAYNITALTLNRISIQCQHSLNIGSYWNKTLEFSNWMKIVHCQDLSKKEVKRRKTNF